MEQGTLEPPFETVDTNNNGEIEYSEAEAVTHLYLDPSVLNGLNAPNYTNSSQNNNPVEFGPIDDLTGIEAFTNLQYLNVRYNNLTTLDLSNNVMLDTLLAEYNELTTLEIGENNNLKVLLCDNNQIDTLDLSSTSSLKYMYCRNNELTYLDIRNNENIILVQANGNPDLICIYVDDMSYAGSHWVKDSTAHWVENEAECDALGLEDYVFQNINIYPNPVKDNLSVEGLNEKAQVALYDVQGKKIWAKTTTKGKDTIFDVSSLNTGLYFLRVPFKIRLKPLKS